MNSGLISGFGSHKRASDRRLRPAFPVAPQRARTGLFQAEAGEAYDLDSTAGAFDVRMPANPRLGDRVWFTDTGGVAHTYNITLLRGSQLIMNLAEDMAIDASNVQVMLEFNGPDRGGWRLR